MIMRVLDEIRKKPQFAHFCGPKALSASSIAQVSVEVLLQMRELRAHEELKTAGDLTEYQASCCFSLFCASSREAVGSVESDLHETWSEVK